MGLRRQKLLEPTAHRAPRRGAGVGVAGTLQVQEGREGALAEVARAKAPLDRDGDLSASRTLPGKEGLGTRSLAPHFSLVAQGVEPHHELLPLPSRRRRLLLAVALLGATCRLKTCTSG